MPILMYFLNEVSYGFLAEIKYKLLTFINE